MIVCAYSRLDTECLICMKGPQELCEVPDADDPEYNEKILNARHFFMPCNHSNICGGCAIDYVNHQKSRKKVLVCPNCKAESTGVSPFDLKKWV